MSKHEIEHNGHIEKVVYPQAGEVLEDYIRRATEMSQGRAYVFNKRTGPRETANTLMKTFEPRQREEAVRVVNTVRGPILTDPYADRLIMLTKKFVRLNERDRLFVLDASAQKFYWRGDSMALFRQMYAEFKRMKEIGRETFRSEVRAVAGVLMPQFKV